MKRKGSIVGVVNVDGTYSNLFWNETRAEDQRANFQVQRSIFTDISRLHVGTMLTYHYADVIIRQ